LRHEILFDSGATFLIKFKEFRFETKKLRHIKALNQQ